MDGNTHLLLDALIFQTKVKRVQPKLGKRVAVSKQKEERFVLLSGCICEKYITEGAKANENCRYIHCNPLKTINSCLL